MDDLELLEANAEGEELMQGIAPGGEYDSEVTTEHRYLGRDLSELHGRTVTEGGTVRSMLVLCSGMILIPGETLPLKYYRQGEVNIFADLVANKELFGILDPNRSKRGTTVQIRSYKLGAVINPDAFPSITVIVEGIQQFELVGELTGDFPCYAKVRILKDVTLQSPEKRLLLEGQRPRGLMAACSPWPSYLYASFAEKSLIDRVTRAMLPIVREVPQCIDPAKFSYWVTANLPINEKERRVMLEAGSTQERLLLALSFLTLTCEIACTRCNRKISSKEHIISMSRSGTQNKFVNMMGYVHDLLTVSTAENIRFQGSREKTYSWFPGYAWTTAICASCNTHLGWRFDTFKNLQPERFFGLTRHGISFIVNDVENRLISRNEAEIFVLQSESDDYEDIMEETDDGE